MAFTTTDFVVKPSDGWVLVATDPAFLFVKPSGLHAWFIAVTSSGSAPVDGVTGVPMGRGGDGRHDPFQAASITGGVYVRVPAPVDAAGTGLHFGVIAG